MHVAEIEPAIWDRARLQRFTFADPALAREIVGLFLGELGGQIAALAQADEPGPWHIAAHTLKGSAATVGALALAAAAHNAERLIVREAGACRWAVDASRREQVRRQIEQAARDLTAMLRDAGYASQTA